MVSHVRTGGRAGNGDRRPERDAIVAAIKRIFGISDLLIRGWARGLTSFFFAAITLARRCIGLAIADCIGAAMKRRNGKAGRFPFLPGQLAPADEVERDIYDGQ